MRALLGKRMIPGISGILTVVGRMVGTGKALLTLEDVRRLIELPWRPTWSGSVRQAKEAED